MGAQLSSRLKRAQRADEDRSVRSVADDVLAAQGRSAQARQLIDFILFSSSSGQSRTLLLVVMRIDPRP